MDTLLVKPGLTDVLHHILGKSIEPAAADTSTVFVTALASALVGVVLADQQITLDEKQGMQATLDQLVPGGHPLREHVSQILRGVQGYELHQKPDDLETLWTPLEPAERLLLVGLAYRASASDGEMAASEVDYLKNLAQKLGVAPRHETILEEHFGSQDMTDRQALEEVRSQFVLIEKEAEPVLVNAARLLLDDLPTLRDLGSSTDCSTELEESIIHVRHHLQTALASLQQTTDLLNQKPRLAQMDAQDLWMQVADCTGRFVKFKAWKTELPDKIIEQVNGAWSGWLEGLRDRLWQGWSVDESAQPNQEQQKQLTNDLVQQLTEDLETSLDQWLKDILSQHMTFIDQAQTDTYNHLLSLKDHAPDHRCADLIERIEESQKSWEKPLSHLTEGMLKGVAGSDLENMANDLSASISGALGGLAGVFKKDNNSQQPSIKQRLFDRVWERFNRMTPKIVDRMNEQLPVFVSDRIQVVLQTQEQTVTLLEAYLSIRDRDQRETPEHCAAERAWVAMRQQELQQMQAELHKALGC
jgi:uncharacterized tellurite resistance protein B-like protein/gas vesicle protein